jgi:GR25 family glycosyltransferase involved in LPS biosynthesis
MTNESFFFDRTNTFCISLYSHTERWKSMEKRFSELNLDVTRFKASTEIDLDKNLNFSNSLNTLQKCCAQSHIKLWKHILTTNVSYALILEDDACFDKEWKAKLETISQIGINNYHDCIGWDAIFLNASEPEQETFKWINIDVNAVQYLTGGYIISREGLKKILDMFSNEIFASDWMTSRLQTRLKCYTYFPWLIIQEGKESTINSGVDADHAKVLRCLNDISYSLDNYIV